MLVARVLPNVTGLDKRFDYLVPDELVERVGIGTIVRVDLHGRRIGGWVVGLSDQARPGLSTSLKPVAHVTGYGPDGDLIELAEWAAVRWAARRIRPFLAAASPKRAVPHLPASRRTASHPAPSSPATTDLLDRGGGVLRLPPRADVMPSVFSAIGHGPTLVVAPSQEAAALLAIRLRRAGVQVAEMPDGWAAANAGVDVVIGSRSAAWAPCADLASIVLVDEHDEALQEERSPTWHARDVVVERARRRGVPCVLISPMPTLAAIEGLGRDHVVVHPPPHREAAGWPTVHIVDRRDEVPWKRSLVTSALIEALRDHERRVVCVSNTTGRARLLACRSCNSLLRCERCDAAVALNDQGQLECRRCGRRRAAVCQECGGTRFANLRPGVTRLREELEAAAGRPVVAVTGESGPLPPSGVYVGTEAVLHRVAQADVVAFLEFDAEMLAPRYRATEQAMSLLIRAGRMAPAVMVQTFNPEHPVLRAARRGDPGSLTAAEREQRQMLGLPPYRAVGLVSGTGSTDVVGQLSQSIEVAELEAGRFLLRADHWKELGLALNATERPSGARLRIEIDPPRL